MKKKNIVTLSKEERAELKKILSQGGATAKSHELALILLQADSSVAGLNYQDSKIVDEVGVSPKTVTRVRKKFSDGGLKSVFEKKFTPRFSRRKFDGEAEARLIAVCCSTPPEGHARWNLRLLADKIVELQILDEKVSYETVRETLKKTNLNLGKIKNGVFPQKPTQNLSAKWKTS
jgi:hypothetical protein